jgi:hypothetical protein
MKLLIPLLSLLKYSRLNVLKTELVKYNKTYVTRSSVSSNYRVFQMLHSETCSKEMQPNLLMLSACGCDNLRWPCENVHGIVLVTIMSLQQYIQ